MTSENIKNQMLGALNMSEPWNANANPARGDEIIAIEWITNCSRNLYVFPKTK